MDSESPSDFHTITLVGPGLRIQLLIAGMEMNPLKISLPENAGYQVSCTRCRRCGKGLHSWA